MIRYAVCVDVSLNDRKIQGVYIEKYKIDCFCSGGYYYSYILRPLYSINKIHSGILDSFGIEQYVIEFFEKEKIDETKVKNKVIKVIKKRFNI